MGTEVLAAALYEDLLEPDQMMKGVFYEIQLAEEAYIT